MRYRGALLVCFAGNGVLYILLATGKISDGDQTDFIQASDAIRAGEFG